MNNNNNNLAART